MRPALTANAGSRGKIQVRCCHSRMASSCNHRHTVLSLIVANVWPGAITAGSASAADGGRPVGLSGDAGDMGRYLSAS